MPSLPAEAKNPLRLADWLEIVALTAPDRNSSRGDLERAIRRAGLFDGQGEDAINSICLLVFSELERRSLASPKAYPFTIKASLLQLKKDWRRFPGYVFCLCLSYFGLEKPTGKKGKKGKAKKAPKKSHPERLFEHLSREAARAYLGGGAVRLAFPRDVKELPKSFGEAIHKVCQEHICEGDGFRKREGAKPNDDTVDIIAWKDFVDRLPGKMLMFGQCAAGKNWDGEKLSSMNPDAFCEEWMLDQPPSQLVKSLFIPHRVSKDVHSKYTRKAGIIFDRCRIAHWVEVGKEGQGKGKFKEHIAWAKKMLASG